MRRCICLVGQPAASRLLGLAATSVVTPQVPHAGLRWQSNEAAAPATPVEQTKGQPQSSKDQEAEEHPRISRPTAMATMEKAAAARREIFDLWRTVSAMEESSGAARGEAADAERLASVGRILDAYKIDATTPREEDVCRGLGDALDRLLLLCVPLPATSGTEQMERLLQAAGRQGRRLSVRTVQHLFSRTSTFAEALAIFYALRRCHFAMSMESYHAMLYSLQRLEEEGWALRFHDEVVENKGVVSEQALDFVLRGIDNQLMPENKPWLGRIMFAEQENAASERQSRQDYDEMGKAWVERYKGGGSIPRL